MEEKFWILVLDWLTLNSDAIVAVLQALVPVLALCLALYVVHAMKSSRRGRRHD